MTLEESIKDLNLDLLLQLNAVVTEQLLEKDNDPEMILEYQKAMELIQKAIADKRGSMTPNK